MNLLDLRENRIRVIESYLEKYDYIIVVKCNYPGSEKRTIFTNYLVYEIYMEALKEGFSKISQEFDQEGLIFYMTGDFSKEEAKKRALAIEEGHELGRLVDLDVFTKSGQISRADFGIGPRKCYLCEDLAVVCARSRKHEIGEIKDFFTGKILTYIFNNPIERISAFAMANEVMRTISFGTVNVRTRGNHNDMDFDDFLLSTSLISKGVARMERGLSFKSLRTYGLELEREMLEKIGANTHKGMIFHLLIIFSAYKLGQDRESFREKIRLMGEESLKDLEDESLRASLYFRKYGLKGARGQAASGYEDIYTKYLALLEKGQALDNIFLKILEDCEDSNIINRTDIDTYREFKSLVRGLSSQADLEGLEEYARVKGISPGGSADTLALSLVIYLIELREGRIRLEN